MTIAVTENMRHRIFLFPGRQPFEGHSLSLLRVGVIDEQALEQRGYPEVLLAIHRHGEHAGVVDDAVQVVVRATKLLLIVIVGEESFVVSTEPDVLPRVLEHQRH